MAQTVSNHLLNAYAQRTGNNALSRFQPVPLPFKTVLFHEHERPRFVHLLTSGVASLVALLQEGMEVEVAMTSNEGFPEAIFLLGPEMSPRTCFMQVGGSGYRMPIAEYERWFEEDALLRRLTLRFVQYQNLTSTQLVACNGQHDAEQRLARWLLLVQDRIQSPDLPLTQEFLAQMLGSRRSTVTIAASNLQRAGVIDYRRGQIKVLDRERLIETACECYPIIRQLRDNLFDR